MRDRYELDLIDRFMQAGKPVLGICRGCQLINVAFGGTLYQDIATQRPDALAHVDLRALRPQPARRCEFVPGTRLAGLYPGQPTAHINSIHHQAVKDLGRELEVEARAPDGLVEAVRWRGPSYVFGMQWHPEFMAADDPLHEAQLDGGPLLQRLPGRGARGTRAAQGLKQNDGPERPAEDGPCDGPDLAFAGLPVRRHRVRHRRVRGLACRPQGRARHAPAGWAWR